MSDVRWPIKRDEFGCELWLGPKTKDGYPLLDRRAAHRVRWEHEIGPLEQGLMLDHLCRRRSCVALHHLEPVKQSDNERRKLWRWRLVPQCRAGHSMVINAVYTPEGGRVCRQCNRDALSR